MRHELYEQIHQGVVDGLLQAGVRLPDDVAKAIERIHERSLIGDRAMAPGTIVLEQILENLRVAAEDRLPMCQDTGMVLVMAGIGQPPRIPHRYWTPRSGECGIMQMVEDAVQAAVKDAYEAGPFRKSVVSEPVFDRDNTGTNTPAVIHFFAGNDPEIRLRVMMKGFGSENCSALAMPNPTSGREGIVNSVVDAVRRAGGKPCPPIVVGVGIGGTAERALQLSKRALFRDIGERHPDARYADLECEILAGIQRTGIGPGGLGGAETALDVLIETEPTHIAGMPVGVSISCWADRKFEVVVALEDRQVLPDEGSGLTGGDDDV